jgi:CheY-like chemotaxis protein
MSGLRILVVDDDADLRELLVERLRQQNHLVYEAGDGREALSALHQIPRPDLILLDIFMPEMDGFEFRRRQLADEQIASIPVIVMSADPRVELKRERTEAAHYFRKPLDMPTLLSAFSRTAPMGMAMSS